ncbi:hypothetical protein GY45DRAFT_1435285 [Cubamyces sp. BRFM 1775]|nr:hypothetical protein GY45DRAFT_1435285 [Cubamyces sp. BRFM 1775]
MGQNWAIYNIDRREFYSGSSAKLGEWFFDNQYALMQALRVKAPMSFSRHIKERLNTGRRATQTSKFLKLPNEILSMVLIELKHDKALLYFAATCKALHSLSEPVFFHFYEQFYPSWHDCRVVCLGDSMDQDDTLPPGVLTESELEWVASERDALGSCYGVFRQYYEDYSERRRPFRESCLRGLGWSYSAYYLSPAYQADYAMLSMLCEEVPRRLSSEENYEVLCNISKREYIRDRNLTVPEKVTLAHALITMICWSPYADYALNYELEATENMNQGRWVGDKFRIVPEEAFVDSELNNGDWTDVTAEVDTVLQDLCKQEPWHFK